MVVDSVIKSCWKTNINRNLLEVKINLKDIKPTKLIKAENKRVYLLSEDKKVYELVFKGDKIEDICTIDSVKMDIDLDQKKEKIVDILEKKVSGYVQDIVFEDNMIYFDTCEGGIYSCKADSFEIISSTYVSNKKLKSMYIKKDTLIILQENDDMLIFKSFKVKEKGHCGAVWNFTESNNGIYSVGSDGNIVKYNKLRGSIENQISIRDGWINSIINTGKYIVTVGARGEVRFYNFDDELIKKVKLSNWLNNVAYDEEMNELFIVSAEGDLIIYKLNDLLFFKQRVSNSQIIDISIYRENIYLITTDGEFIILDKVSCNVMKRIQFTNIHFTSIVCNKEKSSIYVASMEGQILKIGIDNNDNVDSYQLHNGRVWKVVSEGDFVISICTDYLLSIFNIKLNIRESIKLKNIPTTCYLSKEDNAVYIGYFDGSIEKFVYTDEFNVSTTECIKKSRCTYEENKKIPRVNKSENYNDVIVYYCGEFNSNWRIIKNLDKAKIKYKLKQVNSKSEREEICLKTGWSIFPQVLFNGRYIGSGVVITEMVKNKTLNKIVNNYRGDLT